MIDEGCAERQSRYLIAIAWSEEEADLDLEVTDAGGEVASFGNRTGIGFTKVVECPSDDGCQGQNYELVVTEDDGAELGSELRVALQLHRRDLSGAPVIATLGLAFSGKTWAYRTTLSRDVPRREIRFSISEGGRPELVVD